MVDAINTWLNNGCNYAHGVSLYEQHGTSNFFKGIFKNGETPTNKQKLYDLLIQLRADNDQAAPAAALPASLPVAEVKSAEPALKLMRVADTRKQTFSEIQALHPYLDVTAEGEDLRKIAERIVRAGKRNTEAWARYNYLTEHPDEALPHDPPPPAPVMIDLNILERRESVRKSLNKAENRIKGVDKPKPKTLQLIADRRQELKDIDARIAAIRKEQSK